MAEDSSVDLEQDDSTSAPDSEGGTDDVEAEDSDPGARMEAPFDPNKIRVRFWPTTLDLILRRIQEREIDLAPDFQRVAGIWKERTQSRLIESILLKLPLPAFYMKELAEEKLAVIDGIQRLTACRRFVLGPDTLRLQDLEYLTELNGKTFAELPRLLQRRLLESSLSVYVVEPGTPEAAAMNLFKRINVGGSPLTPQEIRHAMNPGPVRDWLRGLARSGEFRRATDRSVSTQRMVDRELVARFVAFCLTSPDAYHKPDLDAFVSGAMAQLNRADAGALREDLARRLKRSLQAAYHLFEKDAFRKRYRKADNRSPINKALFEAWTVGLDACTDDELARLVTRKEVLKDGFIELMHDSEFDRAISQGTGDIKKVKLRFERIKRLIAQVLAQETAI